MNNFVTLVIFLGLCIKSGISKPAGKLAIYTGIFLCDLFALDVLMRSAKACKCQLTCGSQ